MVAMSPEAYPCGVAQTTVAVGQGEAHVKTNENLGFDSQWLCSFLPTSRTAHVKAHLQIAKPVEGVALFHVGGEALRSPATGASAKNNINCHCRIKSVRKA